MHNRNFPHTQRRQRTKRWLPIIPLALACILPLSKSVADNTKTAAESLAELDEGEMIFVTGYTSSHPRLLLDEEALQAAIDEYQANPEAYRILTDMHGFLDWGIVPMNEQFHGWNYPRRLLQIALLHQMTGEPKYAETLHRWISQSYAPAYVDAPEPIVIKGLGIDNKDLGAGGMLFSTALLYDILHADTSYQQTYPEDLEVLRQSLLIQGAQTYQDLKALPKLWYEQNHFYLVATGLGMTALALADEAESHPEILEWANWSRNALRRTTEMLSSDGFYYESVTYGAKFFHYVTFYLEALQRATGENLLTQGVEEAPALMNGRDKYMAHVATPSPGKYFGYNDYGPREADRGYRYFISDLMLQNDLAVMLQGAELTREPLMLHELQREWDARQEYTPMFHDAMESAMVLMKLPQLKENLEAQADVRDIPTWHYFDNHEVLFWRNSWEQSEAEIGAAIFFKSGPPEGHDVTALLEKYPDWRMNTGHAHPDAGSFSIFAYGAYLATDPGYSGSKKTAEHNCLLIDGKGQYKEGLTWNNFARAPYSKYNELRLEDVWLSSTVAAATGILKAAYDDALNLNYYNRHFIAVAGRWIVVRDSISAPEAHEYTWVLNSDRPFRPASGEDRWLTESGGGRGSPSGGGRLIVQSLTKPAEVETAPTLVDVDLSGQRPEPVSRAHHLALAFESVDTLEITNVLCIQKRRGTTAADFTAKQNGRNRVTIQEGEETCDIWIGEDDSLKGIYGFAWYSGDKLKACGFEGSQLTLRDGTVISTSSTGKVTLTKKFGKWRIESDMPAPSSLSIVTSGEETTADLPAEYRSQERKMNL